MRIENIEPPPRDPPAWTGAVAEVEEHGVALFVEAMARCNSDVAKAEAWLRTSWRLQPDEIERAVVAEALSYLAATPEKWAFRIALSAFLLTDSRSAA